MDKEFILRCINGDRASQEILYKTFARKVKGICVRYSRSNFEAEDLMQDSFIKIFTNLHQYNFSGNFEAWVRRIALNTAIDAYKSNLFIADQVNIDDSVEVADEAISIESTINEHELLSILNQLPDGYRLVFNMYVIEGFSHKEIAELLNISEGTSKSQLSKAKVYVRGLLVKLKYNSHES